MKICSGCGAQMDDNMLVCTACGNKLDEPAAPATEAAPAPAPAKKGVSKKLIAIIAGVLALVIVAGVVIACLSGGSEPSYGIYYKDGEVYIVDFESEEPILLTEDMGDWDDDILNTIAMTPDGKHVLFPDEVEKGDRSATIFVRDTLDPEAEAIKMATKVVEYFVADDSDTIIYLDEDGELCRYSISDEESTTIDKDVTDYDCSEDGQNIIYVTRTTKKEKIVTTLYRVLDGKIEEPAELPKNDGFECSDDLTIFIYEEEHKENDKADKKYKTYMIDEEGEETLIDTEVAEIWITEDNTVYYSKAGKGQKMSKFVKNDVGEGADLSVLDSQTISFYDFYQLDKGEAILLVEGVADVYCLSDEHGVFIYEIVDSGAKVKLSELRNNVYDISDAEWYIRGELAEGKGIVADGEAAEIDQKDIHDYAFSEDYDRIYVITDYDEKDQTGVLSVSDLNGAVADEFEQVDKDVEEAMFCDGVLYYLQDDDLYKEGEDKAIVKDALGIRYLEESDLLVVIYDYDEKGDTCAIGIYDGEVIEICDKAQSADDTENGVIIYEDEDDTWFYYVDGESIEIDDDLIFREIRTVGKVYVGSNIPSASNDDYYYDYEY